MRIGKEPSHIDNPICGEMYQSPINIDIQSTVYGSDCTSFDFRGYSMTPNTVSFQLINKGHSGQ